MPRPRRLVTLEDVRREVMASAAPAGEDFRPVLTSYGASGLRFPLPGDNVFRVADPVNLSATIQVPSSGRIAVFTEFYASSVATDRLYTAVGYGRALSSIATTSGAATLTGTAGTFTSADVGARVNGKPRCVTAVTTTSGSPTISGAAATFASTDVGRKIGGAGIAASTTISAVNGDGSEATISINATSSQAGSATLLIDSGIPATATISSVNGNGSVATMGVNATATGTHVISVDDTADYCLSEVVRTAHQGMVCATSVLSALTAGSTRTYMLRVKSQTDSLASIMELDSTVGRAAKIGITPLASA
jgi:hypothetical protein